jgi:hypothetical protein
MRQASIESLIHLSETVETLRKISGGAELSREFVTLANIASACKALYKITNELRWKELDDKISRIVAESK